jgi:GT2 family glycosyltransferase
MAFEPLVAICTPIALKPHGLTFVSLLGLALRRRYFLQVIGRPVDQARNELAEAALEVREVTHLLWIDDDMVFGPDAASRLLEHDLPIVGGLYYNRRDPWQPLLLRELSSGGQYGWVYEHGPGLVDVDATGAGFLLTKREVYEKIRPTLASGDGFFSYLTVEDAAGELQVRSEDVSFCVRAKEAGYSLAVDTDVEIGHVGEVVVDAAFARRNRTRLVDPWVPPASPFTDRSRRS